MRHRLRRLRRLSALAALGLIVPEIAATQARSADTVRVDVDGHTMQLLVSGTGGPAVVLEAGHSATSRTWNGIRDRLAAFTRVVAYDRPGLGGSQMCARPRDARTQPGRPTTCWCRARSEVRPSTARIESSASR